MRAAAIAMAATLAFTGIAFADMLVAFDDTLAPVEETTIAFGSVCEGAEAFIDVEMAIKRDGGNAGKKFLGETAVTVSAGTQTGSSRAAVSSGLPDTIDLPAGWHLLGNDSGTLSTDRVTARITLDTASAWGAIGGSIKPQASGTASDLSTFSDTLSIEWTATVLASSHASCSAPADTTAPVITPAVTGTLGSNGWYTSDVTVSWTVVDAESAVTSTSGCGTTLIDADTTGVTLTCTATSAGGSASESVTVKRDATPPSVSLVGGPAHGGSYYFGSVPAGPSCTASDETSGLVGTCSASGYGTSVGTHTVTASATDLAGNSNSDAATYTVLAWTLSGFYAPVDMGHVLNLVKGGQTVPLKFEVFADGELMSTSIVSYFKTVVLTCGAFADATVDDVEITTTGGTTLRYDSTGGQFIQNWQTPKTSGKCYAATVGLQDGSTITGFFKTR
jgi:hypothetical protein